MKPSNRDSGFPNPDTGNKYGTNPRFWTPPRFSWLWFEFWFLRLFRLISQRSTLQIVALAFVIHSILSMLMLYVHLMYFNESPFTRHAAEHEHHARGEVSVRSRDVSLTDIDYEIRYRYKKIDFWNQTLFGSNRSVNLLNSKLLNSNEMTHIGWFSDHYRWESRVHCFNSRWSLCDTVYSARCKLETIRAIYQYVPFSSANGGSSGGRYDDVYEVFISLRANAEELVEQDTNVAFFGLLALVSFKDSSQEIVRLGFQPEIENWSIRSTNFKTSKPIQSVVIMLTCLGYGGSVAFTDVRLSVSTPGFSDPVHSIEKLLSRCPSKKIENPRDLNNEKDNERRPLKDYEILKFDEELGKSSSKAAPNLLSFVTQVSIDRLTVLEYSLQTWIGGALSLVIHVPVGEESEVIKDWQRMYVKKKIMAMNLSLDESSIILASSVGNEDYPINSLRNLAIEHAKTPFLLLLDADFQPSPGLTKNFKTALEQSFPKLSVLSDNLSIHEDLLSRPKAMEKSKKSDGRDGSPRKAKDKEDKDEERIGRVKTGDKAHRKINSDGAMVEQRNDEFAGEGNSDDDDEVDTVAFVVPAFGYFEMPKKEDPIVGSKEELLELIHREEAIIEPFRLHESSDAHKLTNYWHWYHSTQPYDIVSKFHDKYEPYVIVRKTPALPRYSEVFTNYGMNKVMHITELFAAQYRFRVLHNAWAIHTPHRTSRYYQDFMQNLDQRLLNRAQRFKILERIIRQYNISLSGCFAAGN